MDNCIDCKRDLSELPKQSQRKRCPECQADHKREMNRLSEQRRRAGTNKPKVRYVKCNKCKEDMVVPYREVTPNLFLCTFCEDELKAQTGRALNGEPEMVRRLGRKRALSGLNVVERPSGYYVIEGRLMAARMVV